jgi:hypothetical protein
MKLKVPRRWLREDILQVLRDMNFKCVGEEGEYSVFEGPFGMAVSRRDLGLGARELRQFTKEIKVEGGKKSCSRAWFVVKPLLTKHVHIRMSPEMYELLKQYAKEDGRTPSQIITDAVGNMLLRWMEKKKEEEQSTQGIG